MGKPENKFTWKTYEQEAWEKVRDKAFSKTLNMFIDFLKTQDQLVNASDLIHGLTYTHMTSSNYVDICRCILWDGLLMKLEDDAQLNVEIDVSGGIGELRIYAHTKGLPLTEGWHIASEPNHEDMMREMFGGDNPVKLEVK
ncbi:MAG: hypothetical protein KAR20_11040 [Candidatus Heimdallarchaeota archaeon]|nr:hypothetical protein [Candidatus Heimdallarchaeota archaeon]